MLAFLIAPPGTGLVSTYAAHWYAIATVAMAVVGRTRVRFAIVAATVAAGGGLFLLVWAGLHLLALRDPSYWTFALYGIALIASSAAQCVRLLVRRRGWDPVYLIASQLYVGIVAEWAYYIWNGRGLDYRYYSQETLLSPLVVGLPILVMAFVAVGTGITRSLPQSLDRLGLKRPALWQIGLAIFTAMGLVLAERWVSIATWLNTPVQYREIGYISYVTFANFPWWVYLVFAIVAGFTEETLFRGAMQPRFGIPLTALAFAMGHIQYGLTLILFGVFVHGLIFGLLRRYANTTTSAITHATFDFGEYLVLAPGAYLLIGAATAMFLIPPAILHRDAIWHALRNPRVTEPLTAC